MDAPFTVLFRMCFGRDKKENIILQTMDIFLWLESSNAKTTRGVQNDRKYLLLNCFLPLSDCGWNLPSSSSTSSAVVCLCKK